MIMALCRRVSTAPVAYTNLLLVRVTRDCGDCAKTFPSPAPHIDILDHAYVILRGFLVSNVTFFYHSHVFSNNYA